MRSSTRVRMLRTFAAAALIGALLLPAAAPATAQADNVLRVGTTQDLDSMNPFQTALVTGFEVFTLNYDLLVNFGPDLEPVPGFAESWTQSSDGLTWTFKIHDGMTWSDGKPATAEDARWTLQLVLDALATEDGFLGAGYLDPYVSNAGVTKVEAPDATTLVVTTDRPNAQVLQMYIPIVPKHVWEKVTPATMSDFTNDVPIVGSGPYQAVEWQVGQFIRFEKNKSYWKDAGGADEVIIQIFSSADTMVQALRTGQLDYAHGVNADQFDALKNEPDIATVAGTANGWTEFGFNTYGTGTGKTIDGGGPSTKALQDPKFRDAIGYAIDKQQLVARVLGGYGEVGTTNVAPFQVKWHVEPDRPRTFDIELAKQKLDAAGYVLQGDKRLDKEGKPLNLRLYMPDSETTYPASAQFIQDWLKQLGIAVSTQVFDSDTLTALMLPPEGGDPVNKADYDLFIWAWGGDVDPNSLLEIFTCDQIGSSSDSNYCNPAYDALFEQQNKATSDQERKDLLAQMQNLIYDEAPYHILFYDAQLEAYRTDRFSGWQNQPTSNGVPLFGYGSLGYTLLKLGPAATPEPSAAAPTATASGSVASPAPSAGGGGSSGASSSTPLIVGLIAVIAIVVVGGFALSRRRASATDDE
ncbi:MAG TPA: ABC transporter substrate-binding protein [Candidatus Limnocylindrales bacterium]|nr:ABC transporter substrate-binding protein [Candidatus Limnocylindrales bacterium]